MIKVSTMMSMKMMLLMHIFFLNKLYVVVAGDGVHDEHDHCHAYSDNGKKKKIMMIMMIMINMTMMIMMIMMIMMMTYKEMLVLLVMMIMMMVVMMMMMVVMVMMTTMTTMMIFFGAVQSDVFLCVLKRGPFPTTVCKCVQPNSIKFEAKSTRQNAIKLPWGGIMSPGKLPGRLARKLLAITYSAGHESTGWTQKGGKHLITFWAALRPR